MKKNEMVKYEKNKRVGMILLISGIILFVAFLVLLVIFSINKANFDENYLINTINSSRKMAGIMVLGFIGQGLVIAGLVVYFINKDKIKKLEKFTDEKVIPKAKETFNKVEPVVTDVIKTVGKGIKDTANDVKETINKNKNKKGE